MRESGKFIAALSSPPGFNKNFSSIKFTIVSLIEYDKDIYCIQSEIWFKAIKFAHTEMKLENFAAFPSERLTNSNPC